jgi:hypothetical protein
VINVGSSVDGNPQEEENNNRSDLEEREQVFELAYPQKKLVNGLVREIKGWRRTVVLDTEKVGSGDEGEERERREPRKVRGPPAHDELNAVRGSEGVSEEEERRKEREITSCSHRRS